MARFWSAENMPAVIFVILVICLQQVDATRDICTKFSMGPPCTLLSNYHPLARTMEVKHRFGLVAYCDLACTQGKAELFDAICSCSSTTVVTLPAPTSTVTFTTTAEPTTTTTSTTTTTTTTTTTPTTTPRPVTCYYSSQRPAQLTISKRLYSATPVVTECNYPGVVGLVREEKGKLLMSCMATVVEEDVLIINEKNCLTWAKKFVLYVLADSYKTANLNKQVYVVKGSERKLDATGALGVLYSVRLNQKLTFNDRCIQPVCVPNVNLPAIDIDLDDCRIPGYGSINDTINSSPSQLLEIRVKVSATSVRNTNLTITRTDKLSGMTCMSDDSAPVICPHKTTGEWVTVGITNTIGYPCSAPGFTKPVVTNLLSEANYKGYYNGIQKFKYADPTIFSDLITKI